MQHRIASVGSRVIVTPSEPDGWGESHWKPRWANPPSLS